MIAEDKLYKILYVGMRTGRLTAKCSVCGVDLRVHHMLASVCPTCGPFETAKCEAVLFATEIN